MKAMVNDFSDYARAPQIENRPLDLNKLITEVIELYQDNIYNISVSISLDEYPPLIKGDSVRLRQLLHNLTKNALEAMHAQKGAKVQIITHCFEISGVPFVSLVVVDDGPGFPPDILERLFEPYVTTKTNGNGLGLSIVKKIVEEHGGTIRAENVPSHGARIKIRLPIVSSTRMLKTTVQIQGDAA